MKTISWFAIFPLIILNIFIVKSGNCAELAIKLKPEKSVYSLGEPVALTLSTQNASSSAISIIKAFDVRFGHISIQIAYKDGQFKRYVGPNFGTIDSFFRSVSMNPGEVITTTINVLYNVITKEKSDIDTFYAFDKPGKYRLKALLFNIIPNQLLFSDVITIQVEEAKGEDKKVWRLLQTKDAAYFLHFGKPRKNKNIVKQFEAIAARYPQSKLIPFIKVALDKFRESRRITTMKASTGNVEVISSKKEGLIVLYDGMSDMEKEDTAEKVVSLVNGWVQSYNARNIENMIQYMSRENAIRKKWEQGVGDRDRNRIVSRYIKAHETTGDLSIEVVRIKLEDSLAKADVLVKFERELDKETHHSMSFIREDDEDWKILASDI